MTSRTRQSIVHVSSEFVLAGFDGPQPAGKYRVDNDEEQIKSASHIAWRRTGTFIHLPAIAARASTRKMMPINPADLDAALVKDLEQS